MKALSLIATFLVSLPLIADIRDIDQLTNEELWSQPEVVALVEITQGSYDDSSYLYSVSSNVLLSFKGSPNGTINFRDNFPWQYPERLGGVYLVHIFDSGDGFETVRTGSSVIELRPVDASYPEEVREALLKDGIALESIFSSGEGMWVILECLNKGATCEHLIPVVRQAFNKSLQTGASKAGTPE